jgi:hypothetical protein
VKVTTKKEDSVIVMSSLQSGDEDVQSVIQLDEVVVMGFVTTCGGDDDNDT